MFEPGRTTCDGQHLFQQIIARHRILNYVGDKKNIAFILQIDMIEYRVRLKNLSQKGKDVKRSLLMRSQFKSMRAIL